MFLKRVNVAFLIGIQIQSVNLDVTLVVKDIVS